MKARLTNEVITKIWWRKKNPGTSYIWKDINILMGLSPTSTHLYSVLNANEWNGDLTKEAVFKYLEAALGMTRREILEIVDE